MSKYQRLTQIEASPLTSSGAKIITHQFDGSAGGVNWGKSYMELETQFVDPAGNPYVQPVALMDLASEIKYSPSAMLQNVRLSHSAVGVLEENRNVNVHNQTEQYVTKSRGELQTKLQEGYGVVQVDSTGLGHLIVPCSDILGMGAMVSTMDGDQQIPYVFPLDKRGGDCTLRCELEDQVPLFCTQAPIIGTTSPGPVALTFANIAGPANDTAISRLTLVANTFADAPAQALYLQAGRSAIVNFTLGGNTFSIPVVIRSVSALNGIITFDRVWVNQPAGGGITTISLSLENAGAITGPLIGDDANATLASQNITIPNSTVAQFIVGATYTSIVNAVLPAGVTTLFTASAVLQSKAVNAVTATSVDLVFTTTIVPAIPITNADNNSAVFLYLNKTALTARVNQVNLNLYRQPSPNDKPFIYTTLSLEKAVVPSGLTQYQNQFQLESALSGFKLLLTQQNKLVATFAEPDLSSYRVAINNKDVSNRDLVVDPAQNCQAYLDRLKLYYGMKLHNLNRNLGVSTSQQYLTAIAEKFNSVGGDMVDLRYQFGQVQASPNTIYVFKDKVMSV
jgi:hypothetical protein